MEREKMGTAESAERTEKDTGESEGLDISGWCTSDGDKPTWMQEPFQIARKLWATDGGAAIYLDMESPARSATDAHWRVPNMDMILSDVSQVQGWMPLPAVEQTESLRQCRKCKGKGLGKLTTCDRCGNEHHCGPCQTCDGKGTYRQPDPVLTPSGYIAWRYYTLLRALPGVEIGVLGSWESLEDSIVHFRFQGGGGKVLGLKWDDKTWREKATGDVLAARRAFIADLVYA